ncbi:hypothetical protein M0805_004129 [Coniferiporia weirii]|nr:hypothetical protein M0805_004129 [Coniferiporia weirii]
MFKLQLRQTVSSSARRCGPAWSIHRLYSTSELPKASLKLVAELRKRTEISISKAREALIATNNDFDAALDWVQKDLAVSGAKKAAKVEGRETKEGLIGFSLLSPGYGQGTGGVRAAMIELNCETDFVGRNEMFGKLAADVAHSIAFHAEEPVDFQENPTLLRPCSVDALLDAPFLQKDPTQSLSSSASIGSAIRDTIAKIGENISLRRAVSVVLPSAPEAMLAGVRVASYAHGSTTDPSLGRLSTLALVYLKSPRLKELFAENVFREDLAKLERALARQIAGFDTRSIRLVGSSPETALYEQPFMLYPGEFSGQPVKSVLQTWAEQKGLIDNTKPEEYQGIAVSEFARWSVGQNLSSERVVSTLKDELDAIDSQSPPA